MKKLLTSTVIAAVTATSIASSAMAAPTCADLAWERDQIIMDIEDITGELDDKQRNNLLVGGITLLLFWPAIFFLDFSKSEKRELESLKRQLKKVDRQSRHCS